MVGFEVVVNGEVIHRAAVEDHKACSTRVSWINQPTEDVAESTASVGTSGMNAEGNFLKWGEEKILKVGDEVTIRIVDLEEFDEPQESLSLPNEISSEITKMIDRIKEINPLGFGS